jgi:hypothetical protein
MDFLLPTTIHTPDGCDEARMVAARAWTAFQAALAQPSESQHRVDLSNALNYLQTIAKQEAAR